MDQDKTIQSNLWQNKRGRPKKISQIEWLQVQVALIENINYTSPIIRELHTTYINEVFTEDLVILLRQILSRIKVPYKYRHLPVYSLLEESVKSLMISKVDLLIFGLIIEKTDLENSSLKIDELLKILLFVSKNFSETDSKLMNFLKNSLSQEIKQFDEKLGKYLVEEFPSIREINLYYSVLQGKKQADVNYSYYIDEILRNSPPYNRNKKKNEEKGLKKKSKCFENISCEDKERVRSEDDKELDNICEDLFSFVPISSDFEKPGDRDFEIVPPKWTSEDDWLKYQEDSYDISDI